MSEQIDWSKAPEWADKYGVAGPEALHCWYSDNQYAYISDPKEVFIFSNFDTFSRHIKDFAMVVARPSPAWSGGGLPPVGTVCERRFIDSDDEKWSLMDVLCHGKTTIYYRDRNGTEWSHYINDLEFRPIRTTEQIAADDREAAIKEMTANYAKNSDTLAGWAAYVYDTLGYRKP